MYKKIMVTLDGSSLAEQALSHALELAKLCGSELHLLRVVMPFNIIISPTPTEYDMNEIQRRNALRDAHEYLDQMYTRLKPELTGGIQTKVVEGVIVDSILEYADFQNIDLVVMATHGRSGLGRLVFGSVAERVLHSAKTPVLLVRAQPETKDIKTEKETTASL